MNAPHGFVAGIPTISSANLILLITAMILDVVFLILCWWFENPPLNVTILLCAMALSIPSGILLAPVGEQQTESFSNFFKLASSFATGWLVGKVDPFFAEIFSANVTRNPAWGFRILMFISVFSLSVMTVYVFRIYIRWDPTGGAADAKSPSTTPPTDPLAPP